MPRRRPPLTTALILAWADAHQARTGHWPHADTGVIPEGHGLTWAAVQSALAQGYRGLPGGDTLARLLARHRDYQARPAKPPWTAEEDELVRTLPALEAAARTGRKPREVYKRRFQLGVRRPGRPGAAGG
jgi:hypothetical protein